MSVPIAALPAGLTARTRLREAVAAAGAAGALCLLLSIVETQDKALRAHSPWQDDPYDVVVSFSLFILPVLLVAGFGRLPACRAAEAMPVTRARDLLRWARLMTGAAAVCVITEWASVAAQAYRPAWGTSGAGLIAALAMATGVTGTAGLMARRARHLAAPGWRRATGPDWLDDWLGTARLAASRVLPPGGRLDTWAERATSAVRRRPLGTAALIGLATGLVIALGQGIGEHSFGAPGTAIRVLLLFTLVTGTSQFGFLIAAGAYLGIVRRESHGLSGHGRIALRAAIAAAASVPVTIAFRFWIHPLLPALGLRHAGGLPVLIALAAAAAGGAAVITQLAWPSRRHRAGRQSGPQSGD